MYYKLVVLLLVYDEDKYPNSLHYLKKYLNRIKENEVEIIVIDNKQIIDYKPRLEDYYCDEPTTIAGDNSVWEFSGWDKGVEYLKENNIDYDAVLFVNDSFLAPSGYDSPITIINDENIFNCVKNDSIICNIVNRGNEFNIGEYSIKQCMRTHCFILSKKTIEIIKTLVTIDNSFINECIGNTASKLYFLKDAPICINAKRDLVINLTKNWHSAFDINKNWNLFRMKSMAMLNEMTLLARIEKMTKTKIQKNIINNLSNNDKIICVGAGRIAHEMMKESDLAKKNIIAFLDNYATGDIDGIPIYTPENFIDKNIYYDYAIFTILYPENIKNQLLSLGIKFKQTL